MMRWMGLATVVLGMIGTPCFANRLGDGDNDGDVDLADFLAFAKCFTAPLPPGFIGCPSFDFDEDGDVDLADAVSMQAAMTAPDQQVVDADVGDWGLYMMRLVNRARREPCLEGERLAVPVVECTVEDFGPAQPLAYDLSLAAAAQNHTNWLLERFYVLLTHYETVDGARASETAIDTAYFTGYEPADRAIAAGFGSRRAGENAFQSVEIDDPRTDVEAMHRAWFASPGHRRNIFFTRYRAFGFGFGDRRYREWRKSFAVQVFGIPGPWPTSKTPPQQNYILGLIYADRDGDGEWTPRDSADPLREGVSRTAFDVFDLAGQIPRIVMRGETLDSGSFSVLLDAGVYTIHFRTIDVTLFDIVLGDQNVDAGDIRVGNAGAFPRSTSNARAQP